MGSCACPCCFTPKSLFNYLGLLKDMKNCIANLHVYAMTNIVQAQEFIYKSRNTVDGLKVKHTLGDGSWVPTIVSASSSSQFFLSAQTCYSQNQFVKKLGPLGLDTFQMLVVDFMHECELGTWKAPLTHLIRLIYALPSGSQLVVTLDKRYTKFVECCYMLISP
jgi:hypothetical protein